MAPPKKPEVDLNPEGFTAIRNGIRDHIKKGKLLPGDLGVYVYLHLECDWRTGIYHGTALGIAHGFHNPSLKREIQDALYRLRREKYINYRIGNGSRGGYEMLIHKFRPTVGQLYGRELNAWEHGELCKPFYEPANGGRTEDELRTNGGRTEDGRIPDFPEDQDDQDKPDEPIASGLPSGRQEQTPTPKPSYLQDDEEVSATQSREIPPAPRKLRQFNYNKKDHRLWGGACVDCQVDFKAAMNSQCPVRKKRPIYEDETI